MRKLWQWKLRCNPEQKSMPLPWLTQLNFLCLSFQRTRGVSHCRGNGGDVLAFLSPPPPPQRQNILLHLDEQTRSLERHFQGRPRMKVRASNFCEASRSETDNWHFLPHSASSSPVISRLCVASENQSFHKVVDHTSRLMGLSCAPQLTSPKCVGRDATREGASAACTASNALPPEFETQQVSVTTPRRIKILLECISQGKLVWFLPWRCTFWQTTHSRKTTLW